MNNTIHTPNIENSEIPLNAQAVPDINLNLMGESDNETDVNLESSISRTIDSISGELDGANPFNDTIDDPMGNPMDNRDQIKWSEDLNKRKIFVGNVPFNCTQEEFEECFSDISGVYKADIVKGHKDDSRGIGFVTMNTIEEAETLKCRTNIKCKGRNLRFYPYQNNASKNSMESINNYVYIDGIPADKDRKWLKNAFKEYGPFNRYFIAINHDTGEQRSTGFLDLVDDHRFDKLLGTKYHTIPSDTPNDKPIVLTTTRYRQKTIIKNKPRKNAKKEQLLSAMIIEEHKGHARERSGKRFRRYQ
jgi:RNA recognition motif-containing protein